MKILKMLLKQISQTEHIREVTQQFLKVIKIFSSSTELCSIFPIVSTGFKIFKKDKNSNSYMHNLSFKTFFPIVFEGQIIYIINNTSD